MRLVHRTSLAFLLLAIGCGGGRTRTPTQGPITVSGTCAAESAGDQDGYSLDLTHSWDASHSSLEISIDHGRLTMARLEAGGLDLAKSGDGRGEVVLKAYRGEVHPNAPLVVGEWVSLTVPLARVEDGAPGAAAQVKVRVLGADMEFTGGASPIKGACSWGTPETP